MSNPWFKFYASEYLSDPKVGSLTPQERSCWVTILCLAGTSSTPGVIEYLTVEVLLQKSGIQFDPYHPEEWDKCLSILSKLEKMKMITANENGVIEVLNWKKRQEHNLTNAERQAKYRENKKSNESVTSVTTKVTLDKNRIDNNINIDTEFPSWLNKEKWEEWTQHRKEIKKKMTPMTIKKQLQFLSLHQKDHIKIINRSIMNGWQGLFPLDNSFKGNSDAQKVLNRQREDREAQQEREQSAQDSLRIKSMKESLEKLTKAKTV